MATTIHFTLDDTIASLRAVRTLVDAFLADHDGKPSAYTQALSDCRWGGPETVVHNALKARDAALAAVPSKVPDAFSVTTGPADLLNSRTLEAAPPPPSSAVGGWTVSSEVPGALEAAPPPPPPPTGVELDSAGQPWDEKLHASSKAKVADGTWRKKRGTTGADAPPVADAAPPPPVAPTAGGYPTTIAQLMPTNRPFASMRAPPELPLWIAAAV